MVRSLLLLFLLCSCAALRPRQSLTQLDPEKLLDAVRVTGEGRGRLSFGQSESQYVFGVESLLNDQTDWIIAVSVPLQGEEVMVLPDLRHKEIQNDDLDSFEDRIQREFKKLKFVTPFSASDFLRELRSLIRFQLAGPLGLKRVCKVRQGQGECSFDGESFRLQLSEKELKINKSATGGSLIQLRAQNLTDSFFKKVQISLYVSTEKDKPNRPDFSLELFW